MWPLVAMPKEIDKRSNVVLREFMGFEGGMLRKSTFLVIAVDLATSGKGAIGAYIGICVLAACLGIADAQVEGGMVGDLCFMCPEFIQVGYVNKQKEERLSNKQLFIQNIDYTVDLFLIYVITLSIFPGFLYENTGTHQLGTWYPVVLIVMYNTVDFISRCIPLVPWVKLESRKDLLIATSARFFADPSILLHSKI
ncbi:hypothetical protein Fmac_009909 [Flemingia macrophylla]|uniref:Uncharacterized protein n=1 Tax=Flemingia macrophylla TaxID=520843 RepID=A0ABD1N1P3_9FABA